MGDVRRRARWRAEVSVLGVVVCGVGAMGACLVVWPGAVAVAGAVSAALVLGALALHEWRRAAVRSGRVTERPLAIPVGPRSGAALEAAPRVGSVPGAGRDRSAA